MKFGILCAMDEEIKELKTQLTDEVTTTVGKVDFLVAGLTTVTWCWFVPASAKLKLV